MIYPNYYNVASGIIANFWHYDPEKNDWFVYGAGVVKGRQVVPNPGVAIYEFTGAMFNNGNTPPSQGPAPGGGPQVGDPVDLATGLFVLQKTDLFLPDVLPLTLRRTYRPGDPAVRPFGIGATHEYAMFLWSAQEFQEVDLVLPDGGRVHYVRISPGTTYSTAEFEHTTSPTAFYKSRVKWNGMGWDLTLKDGTVFVFGMQAPLQTIRDRYGNVIRLSYSGTGAYGAGTGNITRIDSPHGRWIELSYDGSNRVTQARDNIGRTVGYQYDASGRLWKITDPGSGTTEYTYDTSHRMLTIKDPRGIVFLTNQYDANGRVSLQTQADSMTFDFDYTLDQNGKVTQPVGRTHAGSSPGQRSMQMGMR